jgi:hypothetical protein
VVVRTNVADPGVNVGFLACIFACLCFWAALLAGVVLLLD